MIIGAPSSNLFETIPLARHSDFFAGECRQTIPTLRVSGLRQLDHLSGLFSGRHEHLHQMQQGRIASSCTQEHAGPTTRCSETCAQATPTSAFATRSQISCSRSDAKATLNCSTTQADPTTATCRRSEKAWRRIASRHALDGKPRHSRRGGHRDFQSRQRRGPSQCQSTRCPRGSDFTSSNTTVCS